jgi:uncharacterized protein YlxP (DUF503 family)
MAKKKMTKAQAQRAAGRIMEVAAAGAHCLRKMRLVGKKLTARQKERFKVCIRAEVGPKKK